MALSELQYTKDWTNSADFPTVEESETQVRSDMQFLFNEIKEYINDNFVNGGREGPFSASQIPFKSSKAVITSTNIREAIDFLYDQINAAVTGSVSDGAITTAKLATGAVTNVKIADASIDISAKVTGLLPAANGGMNADLTTDAGKLAARTLLNLGSVATKSIVPVANGGTGSSTASAARENLGLGSLATLSNCGVANGGTGGTTVAEARNNLGLGNTDGALPVANGGTGATTAAAALVNLGAQAKIITLTTDEATVTSEGVTVTATGVTASNTVIATFHPDYKTAWTNGGVYMSAQGEGTITLKSDISSVVKANIIIFN